MKRKKKKEFNIYKWTTIILALIITAVTLSNFRQEETTSIETTLTTTLAGGVKIGDTVSINYIARFANGTIFDTSYEDIAKRENISLPMRTYEPLTITVGSGQLMLALENEIVGMKPKEEKIIKLQPEDAYGLYDSSKIQGMNRSYSVSRIDAIPTRDFEIAIGIPQENTTMESPNIPWPIFIINVTNESVYLRYNPEINSAIPTMLGNATVVNVTDTEIWLREYPIKGAIVSTRFGQATVLDFDNETITLDFNHPLAGKTLEFTVKLEDVESN